MIWFILTVCGVLFVAFAEIAQKVVISGESKISAETNNFVVWIFQGILSLIFLLIFFPNSWQQLANLPFKFVWLVPMLYFWGGTLYYSSYKEGSVSISNILVGISSVVSTTLGIIFLHESGNIYKILGLGLIIGSILFVNYNKSQKLTKSNLLALAGGVIFGITFIFDKTVVLGIGPHLYQVLMCFSVAIATLIFRGKKVLLELKNIKLPDVKIMAVSAISFFGYNKLFFLAYQYGGEAGRVDAINNTVIFFIIVLEFLLLKQRDNLAKKIIAAVIAFSGVTILALAK